MNFITAFERVIGHEGGLSLDPNDRGNWTSGVVGVGELKGTKYGIAAHAYPTLNIAALTLDDARQIYKRDFWDRVYGDELKDGVAYQTFDFAVNSGIGNAIRGLQTAVGVAADGFWGPVSRAAALATSEPDAIMRLLGYRLNFMTMLTGWRDFGRGWARRIAQNLMYGAIDS